MRLIALVLLGLASTAAAEAPQPSWTLKYSNFVSHYRSNPEHNNNPGLVGIELMTYLAPADRASWSTQSTLVVSLEREDGIDSGVVNDACAILVEYEELRYTRLQLEPPAGSTAGRPIVR